jgi:hypothetical protein
MIEYLPPIILLLLIYGGSICAILYILRLLGRLVSAHERVVSALESVARKMRDDSKL